MKNVTRQEIVRRVAKERGQVEKLTPSLLARAFGQLVPQPAEKLLERIRNNGTDKA